MQWHLGAKIDSVQPYFRLLVFLFGVLLDFCFLFVFFFFVIPGSFGKNDFVTPEMF